MVEKLVTGEEDCFESWDNTEGLVAEWDRVRG